MEISKIIKSIFLCFLCLIISASVLCACSKSKENQTQNGRGNSSLGEQSSTTQTESANNNDTVVVPNVVGMDKDEAIKKLEGLGLKVETETKHLTYKDNNNTSLGFYDDGYVLEQDSKSGTVMVKGSTVNLTYNSNTSQFKYKVNEDGTITLTDFSRIKKENNKSIILPKDYDGYVVSTIEAGIFERLLPYAVTSNYKILVPRGIIINNSSNTPVEFY